MGGSNISREEEINPEIKKIEKKLLVHIAKEIEEIKKLAGVMETTEEKLRKHYAHAFPKKCNNCGKVYNDIDSFITATASMADVSTIFDDAGLQEYRNCVCGSTLLLLTDDRRDKTELGGKKRKIFHDSLAKLRKESKFSEDDLRVWLRTVFHELETKD